MKCVCGAKLEEIRTEMDFFDGRVIVRDVKAHYCPKCKEYTTTDKCDKCGGKTEVKRRVSFLDAPGHETLMTTVISASSIMDGALLLIAANEECPMPQTAEHLMVLNIIGIKNIVVVQTKVDLVSKEKAKEHYNKIKEFLKGSVAENAPVIPVIANHGINVGEVARAIEVCFPKGDTFDRTPDIQSALSMLRRRRFDIVFMDMEILKASAPNNTYRILLQSFWQLYPSIEIVVMSRQDMVRDAVMAVKAGASNYLTYPINADEVEYVTESIYEFSIIQSELQYLRDKFWQTDYLTLSRSSEHGPSRSA